MFKWRVSPFFFFLNFYNRINRSWLLSATRDYLVDLRYFFFVQFNIVSTHDVKIILHRNILSWTASTLYHDLNLKYNLF